MKNTLFFQEFLWGTKFNHLACFKNNDPTDYKMTYVANGSYIYRIARYLSSIALYFQVEFFNHKCISILKKGNRDRK